MPVELASLQDGLTNSDLLQTWRRRKKESDASRWENLMKGLLNPVTDEDRSDIQLREALRTRGLFNEKFVR
jgi:hypothetical protein